MKSLICFFLFVTVANAQTADDWYNKAVQLQQQMKEEEALTAVNQCLTLNATHFNGLCKASYLYAKCGNRLSENSDKIKYFNHSKRLAGEALKQKPGEAEAHYAMAIAMGRIALISGPSDKVGAAREIKKHVDAAIRLNPNHASAWYLLGKWNFEMANLNFAEEAAAEYLFGGIPDGASVEKAIQAYQKAIALDATRLLYRYDLAKAYYDVDKVTLAKSELQTLLKMPITDQDDPDTIRKAKELLNDLND